MITVKTAPESNRGTEKTKEDHVKISGTTLHYKNWPEMLMFKKKDNNKLTINFSSRFTSATKNMELVIFVVVGLLASALGSWQDGAEIKSQFAKGMYTFF